jgi:hypothetical protein
VAAHDRGRQELVGTTQVVHEVTRGWCVSWQKRENAVVTGKRIGRLVVGAVLLTLVLPAETRAQDGRWRAAGAVEYAHITEDDGFLGSGPGVSGTVEFRLTGATDVGLEVGAMHHIRDLGFHAVAFAPDGRIEAFPYTERWEGTATFVVATVSHAFGTARARPVVWGGAGVMWQGGTSRGPLTLPAIPPGYTLQGDVGVTRKGRSSSGAAVDGGAGVDIDLVKHMAVRPFFGLRLVNTENVGPKYIIRLGGRVAVTW